MIDDELNGYFNTLDKDKDIQYLKGVTLATLFRFLNGSVYLTNIEESVVHSVLSEFQSVEKAQFILSFFSDVRYREKGLKTDEFKKSLLGNYLRIYHPCHVKVNLYHDAYIIEQIGVLNRYIERISYLGSLNNGSQCEPYYENIKSLDGYSFFPTRRAMGEGEKRDYNHAIDIIMNKGMDSLGLLDETLMRVLYDSVLDGIEQVMSLYTPERPASVFLVLFYALNLYEECQRDAVEFADNFDSNVYNKKRKELEKKIAFDTVFVYLLLSQFNEIDLLKKNVSQPVGQLETKIKLKRPTLHYLKSRFNMSSNNVLKLQKKIILKCILFSIIKKMKEDNSKTHSYMDVLINVKDNFVWIDTNEHRRDRAIYSILVDESKCCTDMLAGKKTTP
ncbi:hypothetical protein ABHY64_001756 [Yersinia enterocolitica]